jgi:inosine-uridine preferring nucleoside hydrolase
VFGNCAVGVTTRNALALPELAGHDLPVAMGAAAPVATEHVATIPHLHGEDGLGEPGLLVERAGRPVGGSAAEFLCRHAPGSTILTGSTSAAPTTRHRRRGTGRLAGQAAGEHLRRGRRGGRGRPGHSRPWRSGYARVAVPPKTSSRSEVDSADVNDRAAS